MESVDIVDHIRSRDIEGPVLSPVGPTPFQHGDEASRTASSSQYPRKLLERITVPFRQSRVMAVTKLTGMIETQDDGPAALRPRYRSGMARTYPNRHPTRSWNARKPDETVSNKKPRRGRGFGGFQRLRRILRNVIWWPGTESNRRHGDFQSPALPTELPGQGRLFKPITPAPSSAVRPLIRPA